MPPLLALDSPVAARQPKTDRLILARFLKTAASDKRLDQSELQRAQAILTKWADLESSGRLFKLKETQMQGDFLAQVFGDALGYAGPLDGAETWQREQHYAIAGQTPDAILGSFRQNESRAPLAVVELKGPKVHLDRDRSNGRTAVDQCWDYLINTPPTCRWGIVSNFVSFRLYERDSTKRAYEHFSLQSLRDFENFIQFYLLFHRQGLIETAAFYKAPRAVALLKQSAERQREVGEKLYEAYSTNRTALIAHLHFQLKHPLNDAIEMAQRLFDRVMFVAFCEDRGLLPEKTITNAFAVAGFHAVTNPRWQNFKNLFRFIDKGRPEYNIPEYNGGLFTEHPVDNLELPDTPWTTFFNSISTYDFADEVNLDVLGNLFERSITELEKLKESGLFGGDAEKTQQFATMPQSAKRKQLGIYYTPPELTSRIVQYTVEELIAQRFAAAAVEFGIPANDAERGITPDDAKFWPRCFDILRNLKIVDPACGSGAFLFQAYNALEARYLEVLGHREQSGDPNARKLADDVPRFILQDNLYGVDLSPEAVEITQLALWIRSATPGQTLATLSENIIHGNSLVHDPAVHPAGFDWRERFPAVFNRPESGFDCVIGNPPWERMDLAEREFFSLPAPNIATATTGAERKRMIEDLQATDPELFGRYTEAKAQIDAQRRYCHEGGVYPLTGRGRTNFYAVFAELGYRLVAPRGRVGLLVPSGIASDMTTKDFFAALSESNRIIRLFDFENRLKKFFPDVDSRFKFSILIFAGAESAISDADFVFFAHRVEELEDPARHVALSAADMRLLNPNTRTCPIFRTRRDAEITKSIYRRIPVLVDHGRQGPTRNPWNIQFKQGLFNQTSDSDLFREAGGFPKKGFDLQGNSWVKGKQTFMPVYEAKMLQAFDHRAGSVLTTRSNWVRQGQIDNTSLVEYQNPEHLVSPRFWVNADDVLVQCQVPTTHFLCFKDVTSPTNQRTMIAAFTPLVGLLNSAPIVLSDREARSQCCLLSNLNSFAYDYVIRQKISNVHLNFFIVEQVPTLPPDTYTKPCPWHRQATLESWISERVLKLTCTAEDMLPLADACNFTSGSFQAEYGGRLNRWDEVERAELMADLDAAYFHLYGIDRDDVEYILSTFKGIHDPRPLFPGSVSTAERILQKYDELAAAR